MARHNNETRRDKMEKRRKDYRDAVNDLREADDFDEITEVTQPNITINLGAGSDSSPGSDPSHKPWHKTRKAQGAGIVAAIASLLGAAWQIWTLIHPH